MYCLCERESLGVGQLLPLCHLSGQYQLQLHRREAMVRDAPGDASFFCLGPQRRELLCAERAANFNLAN